MSQALQDKSQREAPAIDRLFSEICVMRQFFEFVAAEHPDVLEEWKRLDLLKALVDTAARDPEWNPQ